MSTPPSLVALVRRAFREAGAPRPGEPLVVALSGGRDSVVLLHLLRFTPGLPEHPLVAAHLDHAMRPGSAADADWVRGMCRAWSVPLRDHRLSASPGDEASARRARYAFLEEVRRAEAAAVVLTAHHADDQAETVLFRVARGTGIRGLRGILPHRRPGVWRPLLEARRQDLARYAASVGVGWRRDPTNLLPLPRNVLRHEILPRLEEAVAPGAVEALAGLARRAREGEEAWESLLPELLAPLDVRAVGPGGVSFLREPLLARSAPVRARLIRALVRRVGGTLTDVGTRSAVTFITAGASGTGIDLPRGLRLRRDLDRLVLAGSPGTGHGRALTIPSCGTGAGDAVVGGRRWKVSWGRESTGATEEEVFASRDLRFPLEVRAWRPGDRMRFLYGRKKLKKVFLEARVPAPRRRTLPVVVDAAGAVLWVPGVARSCHAAAIGGEPLFHIGCTDVDDTD